MKALAALHRDRTLILMRYDPFTAVIVLVSHKETPANLTAVQVPSLWQWWRMIISWSPNTLMLCWGMMRCWNVGHHKAKVGAKVVDWNELSKHGLRKINERGHRLIRLCLDNLLAPMNIFFQCYSWRKCTWSSVLSAPEKLSVNHTDEIVPWNVKTLPRTDINPDPQIASTMPEKTGLQSQMMKPSGQLLRLSQCITEEEKGEATNDTVVNCGKVQQEKSEGHSPTLCITSGDRNVGRRDLSLQRK